MNPPSSFLLELYEPLEKITMINGKEYSTVKILNALEQITNQKILLRSHKLHRGFRNTTIEFLIIKPHSVGQPLVIIGKEELINVW